MLAKQSVQLFDTEQMPSYDADIAEFKASLNEFDKTLETTFLEGLNQPDFDIRYLVNQKARFTDNILQLAWQKFISKGLKACLVAVGGYGRGELHPASDIDLMILLEEVEDDTTRTQLEQLLMFLWDIHLEVGHSVRALHECIEEATKDITVATNLLESRLLAGDENLYERMKTETGPEHIWPSDAFFREKMHEQKLRHDKYDDSAYNLEPNIKSNPGGLRDIQMIGWVAKRHFGAETIYQLLSHHDFLTSEEYALLYDGEALLWKIRFALHITTGRREDRLLFDHQRKLARLFGFNETVNNAAIEAFMQQYYRTVIELNRLNEMLLQLFEERILIKEKAIPEVINERFHTINGYLDARDNNIFTNEPIAMLEVFVILASRPDLVGVRATTIRLIRQNLHLIDDKFRRNLKAQELFLSLFKNNVSLTHALRRMNRYGVLAAYLPAFKNIVGRMQYDLFHVYTVDEHTLVAIRNLRRFTVPDYHNEFPLCSDIISNLSMPHVVYLAALFHDIAKGRGGDHAELGAMEAKKFCRLHHLTDYETKLISWLVDKHLLMSMTAQRKDIDDQDVIVEFANQVADPIRLDCIYLLTIADSRATNPGRWNDYKDSLLRQLYLSARKVLSHGLKNPQEQKDIVRLRKGYCLAALEKQGYPRDDIASLWQTLDDDYFMHSSPEEIIWQSTTVLQVTPNNKPLVTVKRQSERGGSEIFVCTEDRDNVFSLMAIILAQQGLKILHARIHSAGNHCTMNTFIVHEQDDSYIASEFRENEITTALKQGLSNPESVSIQINSHIKRQIKILGGEPEVEFDQCNNLTQMRLKATDRPELLATISRIFISLKIKVHSAKISTIGADVEDIFLLADHNRQAITEQTKLDELARLIIEALSNN